MSNTTQPNKAKAHCLLTAALLTLVGASACLQLDLPSPIQESREADEAPDSSAVRSPVHREPPTNMGGFGGNEGPAEPKIPQQQPESDDGVADAGPLPPTELRPAFEPPGLLDVTAGSLCPSGSVVFLEGVRYVCGGKGEAYDPLMVWFLSSP